MLPDPSFTQAIQNVGTLGEEREVMGGYYPRSRYLETAADFERRGCRRGRARNRLDSRRSWRPSR